METTEFLNTSSKARSNARRPSFTIVVALLALCFLWTFVGESHSDGGAKVQEQIHESVLAGSWYPDSPVELRGLIEGFISKVPDTTISGSITALIVPHAGYAYSGQVAAHAYSVVRNQKFDTVVLIGPSHRAAFRGVAVYDRGGFRTPLGLVDLDRQLISALEKQDDRIRYVDGAHTLEHSLEIQLPFLQVLVPGVKLVPLLMGEQGPDACRWLADVVASCIRGKSVLIVASSDLSHYHPYDQAKRLDQKVADKVGGLDPEGLGDCLASGQCEACGGGPMVTAMLIARRLGADKGRVLSYANSGDVTGDKELARGGVVGYLAAALWTDRGNETERAVKEAVKNRTDGGDGARKAGVDLGLTAEEKTLLHRIARETMEATCNGAIPPRFQVTSSTLNETRGAFVTLHKAGRLRGCIGQIVADRPLCETVAEMSIAAAFRDPRFRPVDREELGDISIEISVLTPFRRIANVDDVQVGIHGILVKRNGNSGLLLPQVAGEYGWDRTTFLEQTCVKAGLPKDAWKDRETEIFIFSADVF